MDKIDETGKEHPPVKKATGSDVSIWDLYQTFKVDNPNNI